MITKITLKKVASYKDKEAILVTAKKVNLIYGLNGTGKSTLSKFLQDLNGQDYLNCSIEPSLSDDTEILVYNQNYIQDNFYNSTLQKGIFSLSKTNKEAKEAIDKAKGEIARLEAEKRTKETAIKSLYDTFTKEKERGKNTTWKIKKDYSGRDRVLEYCLKGYMGSSDSLFDYIKELTKPTKVVKKIDKIKEEVQLLSNVADKINELPLVQFDAKTLETNSLLQKAIVSSGNSNFSSFIQQIGNSDWVQYGMEYLSSEDYNDEKCPFCQQKINKEGLLEKLTDCFDKSYKQDIKRLEDIISSYHTLMESIISYSEFNSNGLLKDIKDKYLLSYNEFESCIQKNNALLKEKKESPSKNVSLTDSSNLLNKLNDIIREANQIIKDFNKKIEKKQETLNQLKQEFWNNMRLEYDQTISDFIKEEKDYKTNKSVLDGEIKKNNDVIGEQKNIIVNKQKDVVNIQDAIDHINSGLMDLGIEDFSIESCGDDLYKIKREEKTEDVFKSLSEGEKMIISFLYFIEECKGKKSVAESEKKKIIVIDDPISSLSHIYVFNIGRLIHKEFLRSDKYEQVFVLTHSLYFFYELAKKPVDIKKLNEKEQKKEEDRKSKLFRIIKGKDGSFIKDMKYNEIQNDYQVYWSVVKNDEQSALLANCMRNIIDYFYSFVLKEEFNNVFNEPELKDNNRFDSFCRYMNRESHSDGQNIFNIKEIDYGAWKEAFKLVFEKTGYIEHYNKMMK